jgi:hypothetical protein
MTIPWENYLTSECPAIFLDFCNDGGNIDHSAGKVGVFSVSMYLCMYVCMHNGGNIDHSAGKIGVFSVCMYACMYACTYVVCT